MWQSTCKTCIDAAIEKQIAEFDGDTSYTAEIVCPHCGNEYSDSWEMEDGHYDCQHCGNSFVVCRNVEVTYTTAKAA